MATKHCICTIATEEQWLFVKIVFWFGVVVVACTLAWLIFVNIEDCLERRRRVMRHRGPGRRNIREEERFEEIRE